jgi:phosphatidate cytidylyltransferase
MKKTLIVRTTTGIVATGMPLAAMIFPHSPLFCILILVFSAVAVYDICHAVQMKNRALAAAAVIMAALFPVFVEYGLLERLRLPVMPVLFGYFLLLVALMLAGYEKTRFSHVLYALASSLGIPASLSCILFMRGAIGAAEGYPQATNLAVYFIFYAFCCAWLTDVFALFVGVKFGKRKLSPKISPKKTVEGAVGGLVVTMLVNIGLAAAFNAFWLGGHYHINLLAVGLATLPIGVVSMLGDLTASVLKRNYGVKDFGHLFPGHGGVMDRFDSLLFVLPFIYALLQLEQSLGLHIIYGVVA